MAQQRVRLPLPEDLTPFQREQAGNLMANLMVDKANEGEGVKKSGDKFRRTQFPAYTKEYKKKKGQSNVDLEVTGNMLNALQYLSSKKGSVLVGYERGSSENGKAEGNVTGSYGGSPNKRKARNFLGLLKSEINAIVKEVRD